MNELECSGVTRDDRLHLSDNHQKGFPFPALGEAPVEKIPS